MEVSAVEAMERGGVCGRLSGRLEKGGEHIGGGGVAERKCSWPRFVREVGDVFQDKKLAKASDEVGPPGEMRATYLTCKGKGKPFRTDDVRLPWKDAEGESHLRSG